MKKLILFINLESDKKITGIKFSELFFFSKYGLPLTKMFGFSVIATITA